MLLTVASSVLEGRQLSSRPQPRCRRSFSCSGGCSFHKAVFLVTRVGKEHASARCGGLRQGMRRAAPLLPRCLFFCGGPGLVGLLLFSLLSREALGLRHKPHPFARLRRGCVQQQHVEQARGAEQRVAPALAGDEGGHDEHLIAEFLVLRAVARLQQSTQQVSKRGQGLLRGQSEHGVGVAPPLNELGPGLGGGAQLEHGLRVLQAVPEHFHARVDQRVPGFGDKQAQQPNHDPRAPRFHDGGGGQGVGADLAQEAHEAVEQGARVARHGRHELGLERVGLHRHFQAFPLLKLPRAPANGTAGAAAGFFVTVAVLVLVIFVFTAVALKHGSNGARLDDAPAAPESVQFVHGAREQPHLVLDFGREACHDPRLQEDSLVQVSRQRPQILFHGRRRSQHANRGGVVGAENVPPQRHFAKSLARRNLHLGQRHVKKPLQGAHEAFELYHASEKLFVGALADHWQTAKLDHLPKLWHELRSSVSNTSPDKFKKFAYFMQLSEKKSPSTFS
mmetsp:Transcript_45560/g.91982  ORF Transcript_45560/g.91982 Transcript_45560/m.91982 type:complete len:506 (+) Transcript_45560:1237-2754(+)